MNGRLMWTYIQTLAWARWREEGIERYLAGPDASSIWGASKVYPGMAISCPGLPPIQVKEVCSNPEGQLDELIRRGDLTVFELGGRKFAEVEPAAWTVLRRAAAQGEGFWFKAAEVVRCFAPQPFSVQARQLTDREVLDWISERMAQAPRGPGDSRQSLYDELRSSEKVRSEIGWDKFRRFCKTAASKPSTDASWRTPGRRPELRVGIRSG